MGIFKSKEERKIERDIEIRKGVNSLRRNIVQLSKDERNWVDKAKRAKKIGDKQQYEFLRRQLKKTAAQKRMRARQLLSIETAIQMKNQAENDAEFAKSMGAVAKSISEVYGSVDYAKTQKNFEKAMYQAETLKEQMEVFLEMTQEHVMAGDVEGEEEVISDKEIDRMLEEEVVREESESVDKEIEKGLKNIQNELDKENK